MWTYKLWYRILNEKLWFRYGREPKETENYLNMGDSAISKLLEFYTLWNRNFYSSRCFLLSMVRHSTDFFIGKVTSPLCQYFTYFLAKWWKQEVPTRAISRKLCINIKKIVPHVMNGSPCFFFPSPPSFFLVLLWWCCSPPNACCKLLWPHFHSQTLFLSFHASSAAQTPLHFLLLFFCPLNFAIIVVTVNNIWSFVLQLLIVLQSQSNLWSIFHYSRQRSSFLASYSKS